MRRCTILSLLLLATATGAAAQAPAAPAAPAPTAAEDSAAIRRAALDYIEGYYTGDGARMENALHPELAKRMVYTDPRTGRSTLDQMGAMTLVDRTRMGGGKGIPTERRQEDFTILDLYHNAAVAKIVASDWVDYLQLARWNGQWKIVNVLWELKRQPSAAASR